MTCPTPEKMRFNSREEALRSTPWLKAYRCRCGRWHLGAPARRKEYGRVR